MREYKNKLEVEDSYREIFEEAILCMKLREVAELFYQGADKFAFKLWNDISDDYVTIQNRISAADKSVGDNLLSLGLKFRDNARDNKYIAALIESDIIPAIHEHLKNFTSIDIEDNGFRLQGTPSGFLTLYDEQNGFYCHSPYDPMHEAMICAENYRTENASEFRIFGCDLGYLPYQIWLKTRGLIDIYIYEYGTQTVEYAYMFGPLGLIDPDILHIYIYDDLCELGGEFIVYSNYGNRETYVSDSFMCLMDRLHSENPKGLSVKDGILHYNTLSGYKSEIRINSVYNLRLMKGYYTDLDFSEYPAEWIVVAAGPSLNDNIDFIRESVGKRTIVAVNRCIERLDAEGIRPDLFIAVDSTDRIVPHIEGHEAFTENIPIIVSPDTNAEFMKKYRGPVYLNANTQNVQVLNVAAEKNIPIWNASGTVASYALEAAYEMGASKIYLVGVDLGYPGGNIYASDVRESSDPKVKEGETARSNDGGKVLTRMDFLYFAEQLESQIKARPNVEVWNRSEHGMYISGTRIGAWWEEGLPKEEDVLDWLKRLKDETMLTWQEKYFMLRQLTDRRGDKLTDNDSTMCVTVYEKILEELVSDPNFHEVHLSRGKGLSVLIFTDIGELDTIHGAAPGLIVDSNERLSGKRVFFKDGLSKEPSDTLSERDTICIKGREYPFYQLPDIMPDLDFYTEVLRFLSKQSGGVSIRCDDKYSLLYGLCQISYNIN
ncbi:Protein of unknown function DUF115 [Lachnospiraceae bacterium XBB2008]|nr:Protein of unknown function DUF115 [Lachnospiraceae bacterium XBB2008]